MIKKTLILCVILVIFPLHAFAGWLFGPDNYEDCVLEKMKGQDKAMIYIVRKACEKKFPFEKILYNYKDISTVYNYKDNIELNWYFIDESTLCLEIINNFGEYTITRYQAKFSKKLCDLAETHSDFTLTATFVFSPGEDVASVSVLDADEYRCMRTYTIWGKMEK